MSSPVLEEVIEVVKSDDHDAVDGIAVVQNNDGGEQGSDRNTISIKVDDENERGGSLASSLSISEDESMKVISEEDESIDILEEEKQEESENVLRQAKEIKDDEGKDTGGNDVSEAHASGTSGYLEDSIIKKTKTVIIRTPSKNSFADTDENDEYFENISNLSQDDDDDNWGTNFRKRNPRDHGNQVVREKRRPVNRQGTADSRISTGTRVKIRKEHSIKPMDAGVRRRKHLKNQVLGKMRKRPSTSKHSWHSSHDVFSSNNEESTHEVEHVKFSADVGFGGEEAPPSSSPSEKNSSNRDLVKDIEKGPKNPFRTVDETQYKLKKHELPQARPNLFFLNAPYEGPDGSSRCCPYRVIAFERIATKFVHWAFRAPFPQVFVTAAIGFFFITFLFAFIYVIIGQKQPQCIGGVDFATSDAPITDAFALSWTTFSTVGYGVIYPKVNSEEFNIYTCAAITVICTLESFVGIIFGSVFAAIIIAKVGRAQSHAQVLFSDVILVRYGDGVVAEQANASTSESFTSDQESHDSEEYHEIPCPIIEFRIVNRLSSIQGGEIIDATVSIVASVDVRQIDDDVRDNNARRRRRGKKGGKKGATRSHKRRLYHRSNKSLSSEAGAANSPSANGADIETGNGTDEENLFDSDDGMLDDRDIFVRQRPFSLKSLKYVKANSIASRLERMDEIAGRAFDTDRSGKIESKRNFIKLELESPDHPFFKRVWAVRHTIDDCSPLLLPEVRKLVRRNGGYWPRHLNNYDSIRSSIAFDQILVSFSGTSNADCNSVYAQHVYYYVNMNIGYRFVGLLYHDIRDGSLQVDSKLINDVTEQAGGGGEPFVDVEDVERELIVL